MSLTSIIKFEGDNKTLVWKHPKSDFNNLTQLIVHENQEAVFFKNGQALDLFESGKYTLNTANIPILKRVLNLPTGGKTPFHCEIYFVNKSYQTAIKWGTDSMVQYIDPKYKIPLQIGASGEMVLSVDDSRKLLVNIVGTEKELTQESMVNKLRALLMTKVKPYIASTMQNAAYTIFEVDAQIESFASDLHKLLIPDFKDYGINLQNFYVTNISKPDGEPAYEHLKDIHIRQYSDVANAELKQKVGIIEQQTEAQKMIIESQAIAKKREQEGYTYQQEQSFDVAKKVAENEGIGEFTGMGVGLGTMAGVGGMVGGMMNNAIGSINAPQQQTVQPDGIDAFKTRLQKLVLMKESGLLSDDEFNAEKKKLLESI